MLCLAAAAGTRIVFTGCSTVVEQPCHPKVEGLSLVVAASTGEIK